MSSLSISKAWDETKAIAARDGRLIAAVALALVAFPEAILGVIAPPPNLSGQEPPSWIPLLSLVVLVAQIVGQVAIVRLALGPATSVGEAISHSLRRSGPALLALLLFAIPLGMLLGVLLIVTAGPSALEAMRGGAPAPAIAGTIILFVLIAMSIWVRFLLVIPLAAAESGGPIQLLRRSWDLTKRHYWRLLGFLGILFVLVIVLVLFAQLVGGILGRTVFGDIKPFTIGALLVALVSAAAQAFFTSLSSVMLARIYGQLAGSGSPSGVPSSGI